MQNRTHPVHRAPVLVATVLTTDEGGTTGSRPATSRAAWSAGPLVVDVAVRPGDEALNITPEGLRWRALNEAVRTPGLRIDGCHARVRPWAGRPCPLACYCRPHVLSDGAVFCILPERLNCRPRTTLATSPQGLRPAARPHAAGPSGVAHVADEDGGGGRSGTGAQDTCARRASAQQRWRS